MAGTSARNRRLLSVLACAFVALMSTLVWPAPAAQAHTELKSSVPSAGARLAAAPQQVRLLFNEKVTPGFSAMTLKVADGPAMTLAAREDGLAVTADVPSSANGAQARGGPIAWKVEYRVVADDGHPINGEISFAVTAAATTPVPPSGSASASTPATSSAPPANASAAKEGAPTGDAQRPVPLPLLVGGGIALAVGAAVWRIRSKPQQGPS